MSTFSLLDQPAQFLKGVGPRRAESLERIGVRTARDLLYHVPRRYDDASTVHPIGSLQVGMDANAVGRVRSKGVIPTRSGLRIFQAVIQDASGMITCSWPGRPWMDRSVREGDLLLVSGPVKFFHGRQIQPREHTLLERERDRGGDREPESGLPDPSDATGRIFVVYPASEDLPQWVLRRIFEKNLDTLLRRADEDEYLSGPDRETLGFPRLSEALRALHRPRDLSEIEPARRRLAFDELFLLQLVHAQVRHRRMAEEPGIVPARTNELIRPLHESLPFELTPAQVRVIAEIYEDMTSPRRMSRLVQGDVGSGKTVVALFAILLAIEGGYQAALMAPTELLAEQHARKIRELLDGIDLPVERLTGRSSGKERERVLEGLAHGSIPLVVGTQALIQEGVDFARLGLVVVDEQHRFGVRQRMTLGEVEGETGESRASLPDVLVMSATPIPRSMAMALYGDLDLSRIDELPPGRRPVKTSLRKPSERDEIYASIREEVGRGRQAYVVYPLVEESEKVDLLAATAEFERLRDEVFPELRVGLLHGQLPSAEKDEVMTRFAEGEIDVLVATTVVEVGIDVPNATIMVIEHAERFGLAQLHQLRGRVGRGAEESRCILVSDPSEGAGERLRVLTRTSDGFAVAQADLGIRGEGDILGVRQHGRGIELHHADLSRDEDLLIEAQRRARELVAADPGLEGPSSARVRRLLELRHPDRAKLFRVG